MHSAVLPGAMLFVLAWWMQILGEANLLWRRGKVGKKPNILHFPLPTSVTTAEKTVTRALACIATAGDVAEFYYSSSALQWSHETELPIYIYIYNTSMHTRSIAQGKNMFVYGSDLTLTLNLNPNCKP